MCWMSFCRLASVWWCRGAFHSPLTDCCSQLSSPLIKLPVIFHLSWSVIWSTKWQKTMKNVQSEMKSWPYPVINPKSQNIQFSVSKERWLSWDRCLLWPVGNPDLISAAGDIIHITYPCNGNNFAFAIELRDCLPLVLPSVLSDRITSRQFSAHQFSPAIKDVSTCVECPPVIGLDRFFYTK